MMKRLLAYHRLHLAPAKEAALFAFCGLVFVELVLFFAGTRPVLLIQDVQAQACGECSIGQCWNINQTRPCIDIGGGCLVWSDPIVDCALGTQCVTGSGCVAGGGGIDPCANVTCARNEQCVSGSCVKLCNDDCPPVCSGGASCGNAGYSQCLDGTNGSRVGQWIEDNPDTSCKTGRRIWLQRRVCGDFEPEPNGGICYEWGEPLCPDRQGCIDPPGNAQCRPFNDSQCTLVDAPDRIVTGNLFTGNLTLKNIGVASWCYWGRWAGGDPLYTLGSQDPDLNKRWGIDLLFPPNLRTIVSPGQSQTFTFRFKAPNLASSYLFSWRMWLQNIEWFGGKCTKTINDRPLPPVDNTCPKFDKVLGDDSCYGGTSSETGSLGTSTCAPSCGDCQNKCQDLYGQNATYLYDVTSHRCGCEAPPNWDPEAATGQRKTCNSASGDPPYDACVLGGKSGIPCYSLTDCARTSHTVCDYTTQSCSVATGAGINQCGPTANPDDELCQIAYIPPNDKTCGGKYTLDNLLGNFGDPLCDFSKDKLTRLLQNLDSDNWKFWYYKIVPCESGYNPNAYNGNAVDPAGAWGLFQMGRGRNGQFDHGDVPWKEQSYNAVQYNKLIGETFAYWACAQ